MGHITNPIAFRLEQKKKWHSFWVAVVELSREYLKNEDANNKSGESNIQFLLATTLRPPLEFLKLGISQSLTDTFFLKKTYFHNRSVLLKQRIVKFHEKGVLHECTKFYNTAVKLPIKKLAMKEDFTGMPFYKSIMGKKSPNNYDDEQFT